MTSESQRLEITQHLLLKASMRSDLFPGLMFSDTAWKVLLHLYIAFCEGLAVTETLAIKMIDESDADVHLALYKLGRNGYVEPRILGDNVSLTRDDIQRLQEYLDFIHLSPANLQ